MSFITCVSWFNKTKSVEAFLFQFCQLQQEALDFFGIEEAKMLVGKTFEIGMMTNYWDGDDHGPDTMVLV